ncbi:unnamed protein product [Pleuronectes platessa]|uniref:Uncharacterized protein n=1 Tax=Pleuronectes platessa TaxID=8262 RepID=A0A9N7U7P9_PLEPL|nr:unnamed protein product [Pleuronectes platessa]
MALEITAPPPSSDCVVIELSEGTVGFGCKVFVSVPRVWCDAPHSLLMPTYLSMMITSAQYLNPGSSCWFISLCLLEPPCVPVFRDHPLLSCLPTHLSTCQAEGPAHHSKACPSPPASSLPQAPDSPASSSSLPSFASFPQSLASPASTLILIPCSAQLCHPPAPPLPSTFASWCPHPPITYFEAFFN